jgi:hypothetical protein
VDKDLPLIDLKGVTVVLIHGAMGSDTEVDKEVRGRVLLNSLEVLHIEGVEAHALLNTQLTYSMQVGIDISKTTTILIV